MSKYHPNLPPDEANIILASILKKSREYVLTHPEHKLTPAEQKRFDELVARRMKNEPIAYLTGHKEFYGIDFNVNHYTLVPRPETEMLVELAIWSIENKSRKKSNKVAIVDVGTGSGNIIISIAKSLPKNISDTLNFYGIDISKEALDVARHNAEKNNVTDRINFIKGNLLDPLLRKGILPCHLPHSACHMIIVANLPYLSKEIYEASMPDVKEYEPESALCSPQAGLSHYKELLKQIRKIKTERRTTKITCFMEISPEQKKELSAIIKELFAKSKFEFKKDLAGKWRVCALNL